MVLIPLPDYTKFSKNSSLAREVTRHPGNKSGNKLPEVKRPTFELRGTTNGVARFPGEAPPKTPRRTVVEMIGLEPTTPALQTRCSPS